jgi:hypothetical protein
MLMEAIERAYAAVTERWQAFPDSQVDELKELLSQGHAAADAAAVEILTVMNPTTRPQPLRLAVLARDDGIDNLYHQEWCELAIEAGGGLYLVYRRKDGNHYAVSWSPATTLPETLQRALPPALALAVLGGDG